MSVQNFSPFSPAVWPAVENMYMNVLFYHIENVENVANEEIVEKVENVENVENVDISVCIHS